MISVPERTQLQISDALSIIASEDFPQHWTTLMPVSKKEAWLIDKALTFRVLKYRN
jgi:hypothetical protein